jgi:hypothetical protein
VSRAQWKTKSWWPPNWLSFLLLYWMEWVVVG